MAAARCPARLSCPTWDRPRSSNHMLSSKRGLAFDFPHLLVNYKAHLLVSPNGTTCVLTPTRIGLGSSEQLRESYRERG